MSRQEITITVAIVCARIIQSAVTAALGISAISCVSAIAIGIHPHQWATYLLLFVVLSMPLLLLATRTWRTHHLYPLAFVHSHPVLAISLAVLGLLAFLVLLMAMTGIIQEPAYPRAGNTPGFMLFGMTLVWIAALAQEVSFRVCA